MSVKHFTALIIALFVSLTAWADIAVVASNSNTTGGNPDVTVGKPTGTLDGHVIFACYGNTSNDTTSVTISGSGWVQIDLNTGGLGTANTFAAWYKVASSEPATYTFDNTGSSANNTSASLITLSGVDTTTPLDVAYVEGTHYSRVQNDATPDVPDITTVTDGAMVVYCMHSTGSTSVTAITPAPNYDERTEVINNNRYQETATRLIATAGAQSIGDITLVSGSGAEDPSIITVAFKPAAGGSPPEFSVAPTLDDCDSDSCTYDFTPDSNADLYWATYPTGATLPSTCSDVQTATGALDDGSAAVTGADSVEIPYTLAAQSTVFCLNNGDGDSDVESDAARERDPLSGRSIVTLVSCDPSGVCENDDYFDPDMAVGDRIEYQTVSNEDANCWILITTASLVRYYDHTDGLDDPDGADSTDPGDDSVDNCLGRLTFPLNYQKDGTGVFTAPSGVGDFSVDDVAAINDVDPVCDVDDASFIWIVDEAITDIDLNSYCFHLYDDTLVYTPTGDSLPTGVTKTDNIISGTPTVEDENGFQLSYDVCNNFESCTTLELSVGYAVETWTVPDLDGMTLNEASAAIIAAAPWRTDAGLVIDTLTCEPGAEEEITDQNPAASAEAGPFDEISVNITMHCSIPGKFKFKVGFLGRLSI